MTIPPGDDEPGFIVYAPAERYLVAIGMRRALAIVRSRADAFRARVGGPRTLGAIDVLDSVAAEIDQEQTVMEREGR